MVTSANLKFQTYLLCYGDYSELHFNIINDILHHVPIDLQGYVSVWCNSVPQETLTKLQMTPFQVYSYRGNLPKYKAMRRMFQDGITQPWVLWLDDDMRLQDGWYNYVNKLIDGPDTVYAGNYRVSNDLKDRENFVKHSSWYKNVPWKLYRDKPAFEYASGCYWFLRADVLKAIDWPDVRLSHCGGDSLLGEAVRQQGYSLTNTNSYTVLPLKAERRGISEHCAGTHLYKPCGVDFDASLLAVL